MMDNRTWMQTEMNETENLLRKKLEEMNDMEPDEVDEEDIHAFKNIYKSLYYISLLRRESLSK